MRIAIVAPGSRLDPAIADRTVKLARSLAPGLDLCFHPQCFRSSGHFAGTDEERAHAFLEAANDSGIDAVWFARGGYGAGRVTLLALHRLNDTAARKIYLGTATPARCSRVCTRAVFAMSPTGRCLRTSTARAAKRRSAIARLSHDRRSRDARTHCFVRHPDGGVQHHNSRPPHRHALSARLGGPCPDARRGVGIHVPDRPGAAAHHQQPAHPGRGRDQARPLQRHPAQRSRFRARPKRTSRGTGAKSPAFPISAAPISATTPPTRSCRSAGFACVRTPWRDIVRRRLNLLVREAAGRFPSDLGHQGPITIGRT